MMNSSTAKKVPKAIDRVRMKIPFGGVLRLIADVLLVNLSILASLSARLFYYLAYELPKGSYDLQRTLWLYINSYLSSSWVLTLICVVMFALSGFYTYGRFYRGRYKVLVVIQAVAIAYLAFGFLAFFAGTNLKFPRGALLLSWALSTVLLVAARVWSTVWKNVIRKERARQEKPEERKINTVLVIGGAGYIGSALVPKLLERGYQVILLDLLLYGTEPIQAYLGHPRLQVLQADFRQIDKVVEAMREVDAVIHLGAIVGDPACALNEDLTIDINVMATRMIAEVAKGSGVGRFIFASTCSVYGTSQERLDERSTLNPVSLYARSKIASEKVLLKMADDHFAPIILRFGTIYGLSGRTRFDLVVNLLTAKAVVDRQITLFGGEQWRPFLHVDDAALSLVRVLEAHLPLVRNQIFNVGSNEQNYTIRQIGELIHQFVPDAEIVNVTSESDKRNYWVDFSKFQNTLGFAPQWTVERGIRQVMEAMRSGKVADYKDAKYSNVKFLTEEGIFRLAKTENGWAYELLNESPTGVTVVLDL
jgi:nucleoside-diphosphate-sugar epimerase